MFCPVRRLSPQKEAFSSNKVYFLSITKRKALEAVEIMIENE